MGITKKRFLEMASVDFSDEKGAQGHFKKIYPLIKHISEEAIYQWLYFLYNDGHSAKEFYYKLKFMSKIHEYDIVIYKELKKFNTKIYEFSLLKCIGKARELVPLLNFITQDYDVDKEKAISVFLNIVYQRLEIRAYEKYYVGNFLNKDAFKLFQIAIEERGGLDTVFQKKKEVIEKENKENQKIYDFILYKEFLYTKNRINEGDRVNSYISEKQYDEIEKMMKGDVSYEGRE